MSSNSSGFDRNKIPDTASVMIIILLILALIGSYTKVSKLKKEVANLNSLVEELSDDYENLDDHMDSYVDEHSDDYEFGYDEGYEAGYDEGYSSGKEIGYDGGSEEGYELGYGDGYDQGYEDARKGY